MATRPPYPTVALIQVRERPDVEEHEQQCVARLAGLSSEQLRPISAFRKPTLGLEDVDADIVLIGGAGVHSVTDHDPFTESLATLVRALIEQGRPMMGLCWGHQFIAKALGGSVITDEARSEVGAREITLTEAARTDPLLAGLPGAFSVLMGHNDRVDRLPDGATELAFSTVCGNQMFRLEGKPVYGAQFHVELTPRTLRERPEVYHSQYLRDEPPLAEQDDARVRETPEANRILRRFIALMT